MYDIYTSHWSNKKMDKLHPIKLAVCRFPLSNRYVEHLIDVAPSQELFNACKYDGIDTQTFIETYKKEIYRFYKIGKLDRIVDRLYFYKQFNNVFLMCFEKNPYSCHRHVLAELLNTKYNMSIKEF